MSTIELLRDRRVNIASSDILCHRTVGVYASFFVAEEDARTNGKEDTVSILSTEDTWYSSIRLERTYGCTGTGTPTELIQFSM